VAVVTSTPLRVQVRVKPRSARSQVLGVNVEARVLEVAVSSPPVDGAANKELIRTVAKHFGLGRSKVRIVSGERGRLKMLELDGIDWDGLVRGMD
jgi:uncharacterized protein